MVASTMDLLGWLRKRLEAADIDLLREMVLGFVQVLMSVEAERALVAVVAECYVRGVSTRRVEGLVATLGVQALSRSKVCELAKTLDEQVAAFRTRPLTPARIRRCGWMRWRSSAGRPAESGMWPAWWPLASTPTATASSSGWTCYQRGRRRLDGVPAGPARPRPVGFGARHLRRPPGPEAGDRGGAARRVWQRCRTHFMRNLLCRVPKSAQALVATLVWTVFAQPDATSTWAQHALIGHDDGRVPLVA